MSAYQLVNKHVEAALAEAQAAGMAPETIASNLLAEAMRILKQHRPLDNVRSELQFAIENLEDRDYEFMRP